MLATIFAWCLVLLALVLAWQVVGLFVDEKHRKESDKWVGDIFKQQDQNQDRSKDDPPPIENHRRH